MLRTDLGTGGMGGGFPMELSKGPVPCVARRVPMPFLDPAGHLHPAISSPLPPRGSNTWARCAGTWRTWRKTADPAGPNPPLRRSHFSSIRKGVTLEEWKNMGRPQEMAVSEPQLARFEPIPGPRVRTQAPHHKPPSGHGTHP